MRFRRALIEKFEPRNVCAADSDTFVGPLQFVPEFSPDQIWSTAASLRFDITPAGFHAQVLSPNGTYYIDPFWHLDTSAYISYYKQDLVRSPDSSFVEDPSELEHDHSDEQKDSAITKGDSNTTGWQANKGPDGPTMQRTGTQLRVYEPANATTGKYTAFHGGSVPQALAAIVTAINRVTGIYETELSIRLAFYSMFNV